MTEAKWLADQQGAKWMISHLLMVRGDSIAPPYCSQNGPPRARGIGKHVEWAEQRAPPTKGDRFNPTSHGNALGRCQKTRQSDG